MYLQIENGSWPLFKEEVRAAAWLPQPRYWSMSVRGTQAACLESNQASSAART